MNFCHHPGHTPKINRLARRIFGHGFPRRGHFTFLVVGVRLCFQSRMQSRSKVDPTVLAHDPQNGLAVKLASPLYWIWPRICTEIPQQREQNSRVLPFSLTSELANAHFPYGKVFNHTQNPLFSIFGKSFSKYLSLRWQYPLERHARDL